MKTPHKVSVAAARSCVPHTCVSRQVCGGRERRGSGTFTLRLHSCVSRVRSGGGELKLRFHTRGARGEGRTGGNSNSDSSPACPREGGMQTPIVYLRVQGKRKLKLRLHTCVPRGRAGGIQTPTTPACKSQAFDSAEIFGSGPAPVVANQIRNKSRQHPKVFPGGPPPQY